MITSIMVIADALDDWSPPGNRGKAHGRVVSQTSGVDDYKGMDGYSQGQLGCGIESRARCSVQQLR
jgi:hypothetical protein